MNVCYGTLVAGLGDQHTAGVGVERVAEDVEQEIALPYKADAEVLAVLGPGRLAVHAPALKIDDAIKVRCVQCMNIGIHEGKLVKCLNPLHKGHKEDTKVHKENFSVPFVFPSRNGSIFPAVPTKCYPPDPGTRRWPSHHHARCPSHPFRSHLRSARTGRRGG